jgi:hypothetical protein
MHISYKKVLPAILLILGLCPVTAQAQYGRRDDDRYGRRERGPYARARALVSRVQRNLERAQRSSNARGRQRERYENAQRHLSQFDERLARGDFDKDKLDTAIDDVKNVVENNTLPPRARAQLRDDLRDLRQMRAVRGRW